MNGVLSWNISFIFSFENELITRQKNPKLVKVKGKKLGCLVAAVMFNT